LEDDMSRSKHPIQAILVAVTAALAVAGPAPATVARPVAACPTFAGTAWAVPALGKSGTMWKVTAKGVSCSFATTWAEKLMHTPYKGEAATKLVGPTGWSCLPSIPAGRGVPGECSQGSKRFDWNHT
jgi:hypothetical protein